MAHAQKPYFIFRRNGRVHLNRQGRQFSRLLAAEACASEVVMLDTPLSEVVWRVLVTHSIRQFPLHFTSIASPCDITFQLDSTVYCVVTPCYPVVINKHLEGKCYHYLPAEHEGSITLCTVEERHQVHQNVQCISTKLHEVIFFIISVVKTSALTQ